MNDVETIRFPVAGMTCSSCVGRITRSLRKMDGVTSVKVDLRHETATVSRDPRRVSDAAIAAAVTDAGYEAGVDASVTVPPDEHKGWLSRLTGRIT